MKTPITLSSVPRHHPEAGVHRVAGKLMAATEDDVVHTFDSETGELSAVAERIVELSDGCKTVAEIVSILVAEFDVEKTVAERDTLDFLDVLVQKRVVVV